MISVPSFILRRLYVKQSLRNNSGGFQFELRNTLGSGYGVDIFPLTLDGKELPKADSFFIFDSQEVSFEIISKENPFTLPMNKSIRIIHKGVTLPEGVHKVGFSFSAQGLGKLGFEFSDTVSPPAA